MTANDPDTFDPMVHQAEGVLATHLGVPIEEAARIIRITAERRDVAVGFLAGELVVPLESPDDAVE
jgi:hypothetical protein